MIEKIDKTTRRKMWVGGISSYLIGIFIAVIVWLRHSTSIQNLVVLLLIIPTFWAMYAVVWNYRNMKLGNQTPNPTPNPTRDMNKSFAIVYLGPIVFAILVLVGAELYKRLTAL